MDKSVFSVFTKLCSHHYKSVLEHSHHVRKKPHAHQQSRSIALPSDLRQPEAATDLCEAIDLPVVDIPYKRMRELYNMWPFVTNWVHSACFHAEL